MAKDYVEHRDGSIYLIGSRIPLVRIVWEFQHGEMPESIQANFSTLTLEQVYGAIAFYLGNKEEVHADQAEHKRAEEEFIKTHPTPPHLKEKLERARQQMLARRT
jgi:uncharacterized protein (DUF433 family)